MEQYPQKKVDKKGGLALALVLFVFVILVLTMLAFAAIAMFCYRTGLLTGTPATLRSNWWLLRALGPWGVLFVPSVLIGTLLAAFLGSFVLKPIRSLAAATNTVATGDYTVQVDLGKIPELENLAASFNTMVKQLAATEALRNDFVSNVSHEFKTPVVSILGFANLLKDGRATQEEQAEYLDIISSEADRLVSLSTNILNLSKYENTEIITDKTPFRMDEQIRKAILLTEPRWAEKEITLIVDLAEIEYNGNEDLTQQIWLNLLDNAIKYTPTCGAISVQLAPGAAGAVCTVKDNGPGINGVAQAHIFEKFYQADTSHTMPGNGLGLPIVKRIVQLCGGSITVESEDGKGAAFTVILPM